MSTVAMEQRAPIKRNRKGWTAENPTRRLEWIRTPETPKWLSRRYRAYYYSGPPTWKPIRLSEDLAVARELYRQLVNQHRARRRGEIRLAIALQTAHAMNVEADANASAQAWAHKTAGPLYSRGRTGAIIRGLPWHLTRDDVERLLLDSKGHCALSGIRFSDERVGKRQARPWMATLDRTDAALGYAIGNVRVVCLVANNALADFGDNVVITLAKAISQRHGPD
jgi:hypothetical protein